MIFGKIDDVAAIVIYSRAGTRHGADTSYARVYLITPLTISLCTNQVVRGRRLNDNEYVQAIRDCKMSLSTIGMPGRFDPLGTRYYESPPATPPPTSASVIDDLGKSTTSMGSQLADSISESVSGSVCVNESLSRRIPKTDRMVYVDWTGDMVGFLVGPVCIQAPRYLNFDQKPTSSKRFFTRFFLFQRPTILSDSTTPDGTMPDLYCSETSRVYKSNGELHQGMTSFYTFSGFGADEA